MMKQRWRAGTIGGIGILAAWFVACAGEDIPPIDNELRGALVENFGGQDGQMAGGGAAGAGGDDSGGAAGAGAAPANPSGGAAGAGGSTPVDGKSSGSGAVCDAFNTILQERCGSAGCHGPGSSQGAFGVSEAAVADFVNEPSTFSDCDGVFIDTANPEDSLIYTKLTMDFAPGCGNLQMPANGDFLTPDETACVLSWLGQF
jgi:hypothetical protein